MTMQHDVAEARRISPQDTSRHDNRNRASAISAVGLTKTYGSGDDDVEAVRGVDLDVERGEVFGFLGPNGAGKSTTVRMLTTLMTLSSGTAHVGGVDVAADPDGARRKIGVALQEAGLDIRQTGREILTLQARLFGMSASAAAARAAGAARAGRAGRCRRSSGQGLFGRHEAPSRPGVGARPRARGVVPRRADDRSRSGQPADRVGRGASHQRLGTTVFLTTQYLEEADQLCNRLAIIDDGLIIREGTPASLKQELRERRGGGRPTPRSTTCSSMQPAGPASRSRAK